MSNFQINILGCGSALPTTKHNLTSQVINLSNYLYMIDCGEGTQLELRRQRLNFNRLHHIFISHMHGDHFFGLPGLISTLSLLGRTFDLTIHAHAEMVSYLMPILDRYCTDRPFKVHINPIDPTQHQLILEDKRVSVYSIPLKHRIPTCGFLFEEKKKAPNLIKEMIEFYQIPIKELQNIKNGADFITPEGETIINSRLTRLTSQPKRYAYCSDTAYYPEIIPYIKNVDLLYHEATFAEKDKQRAKQTFHSTAIEAATIAREGNVQKLLLGHFSARYDEDSVILEEARSIFKNTQIAKEGHSIIL